MIIGCCQDSLRCGFHRFVPFRLRYPARRGAGLGGGLLFNPVIFDPSLRSLFRRSEIMAAADMFVIPKAVDLFAPTFRFDCFFACCLHRFVLS